MISRSSKFRDGDVKQLASAIKTLPSLKRLTLEFFEYFPPSDFDSLSLIVARRSRILE